MPGSPEICERRDRALGEAEHGLREAYGDIIREVFSYGALEIDPRHLVVWILLDISPDELPSWFFPDRVPLDDEEGLVAQVREMRSLVIACFQEAQWPNPENLRVGFESRERVISGGGGWVYFH
ncbi:hypothetical protein Pmi06nite_10130 [Planotetraspora mira]|uniref:Uncharacterized protein n=1 Tax=Planotetraspora mira TaxID=58121 RepID=A0A8J3TKT1_9ACTN|nr:hypothetical protein Pmi06nite_10130 [Planotetraspora mira]